MIDSRSKLTIMFTATYDKNPLLTETESIKASLESSGFERDLITRINIGLFLSLSSDEKKSIIHKKVETLQRRYNLQIPSEEIEKAVALTTRRSMREVLDTLVLRCLIAVANHSPFTFHF